jgi:hypothetical protein
MKNVLQNYEIFKNPGFVNLADNFDNTFCRMCFKHGSQAGRSRTGRSGSRGIS